jgi:hypothetical protein
MYVLPRMRKTCTTSDAKVHFLRNLVRDGHIKLVKCVGTQNVSDTLIKTYLDRLLRNIRIVGTRVPFTACYTSIVNMNMPLVHKMTQI